MDDRTYSKSREKSPERSSQDKKAHSSDKRSRDEHYGSSSSDRHHHSSHREKRRNYGDDRNSRYDRGSSRTHRDRSRERSSWSSSRRSSSKERTSSKSQKERSSYHHHRRDTTTTTSSTNNASTKESNHVDNSLPLGPKADMIMSQPVTSTDQPPTAPAAYYHQQTQQPQVHHHHQDAATAAANEAAWANYYSSWTAADYANAGYHQTTEYTAEQYQQYQQYMQYYQTQDPNSYYGYYDPAYYQQVQPQQQEIPPPPPNNNNAATTAAVTAGVANTTIHSNNTSPAINPPPPPPPPTTNRADVPPPPPPVQPQSSETPYTGIFSGVPETALDNVGYPFQTCEDPSKLFEKIGQVGQGTYGKVYKARNGKTGKLMALKRIRMQNEKDGFPITAMREIKLLQKLKHNRIVELQEIMVAKGSVYMVLEYMDHDLSGILGHPNFNFEPAHVKSLVKQMLEGLAYLHHMGILHRDIKGSNLLINNKGELKIADFGLARVFEKNRAHDYTNRVITLWYRPPELLLGATAYGPAVDIWSVGCIMLEFFAGKAVFNGSDEISQLDSIYKIMGTPSEANWPAAKDLPWYAMVRPKENYPSKFRELFQSMLSPGALELSEALLSMDPVKRPTAAQALEFDYFKTELPEPIMPAKLLDINGDWHDFESKQRKRQKASNASNPNTNPNPNSNSNNNSSNITSNSNNNKPKPQDNRTKATPSSALPSSSQPH